MPVELICIWEDAMSLRIRSQPDFFAGLLFAVLGAAFSSGAARYEIGTAAQMGPGFFPMVLGGLLGLIGTFVALRSLSAQSEEESIEKSSIMALVLILGSIALFAIFLAPLGLILSSVILILISTLASHEFTWRNTALTMLVLIALCYLIFIYGLGLPIPVWPRGL